jgi:hypothetical protein
MSLCRDLFCCRASQIPPAISSSLLCESNGHEIYTADQLTVDKCVVAHGVKLTESTFLFSASPISRNGVAYFKVPRLRSLVLLITVALRWMSMEHWWNCTDRENWSTGRETLYSVGGRCMNEYGALVEWHWQGKTEVLGEKPVPALLSARNLKRTGLGSKRVLLSKRTETNRLSHDTAFNDKNLPELYLNIQFLPHSKHTLSVITIIDGITDTVFT